MCGIAGIYNPDGLRVPPEVIRKMSATIVHRGPDHEGYHYDMFAHLASRRLSIIDLTGGDQPIYNEDKSLAIVYNGEVYNFKEIRKTLIQKGYTFTTQTDTEVILKAYLHWGEDSFLKFRGMFAFCIWDFRKKEILLVRDRMGIKPLYYTTASDGTFIFGSEIKAVITYPHVDKKLRPNALENLLIYGFNVAPYTFFSGVRQLLPGHYMKVSAEGQYEKEYWDIDVETPCLQADEKVVSEQLRHEIEKAVSYGVIADVPVAAYLSGGIDSSTIAGMYSRLSGQQVKTISIDFDQADYNESMYSRQVSEFFDTDHTEFRCRLETAAITKLIYHLEEPMVTLLNLPLFLLSGKVRESGYKVVLSGDGADEILGGYDYFKLLKAMRFIESQKGAFRKNILRCIHPNIRNPVQAEIQYLFYTESPTSHPALPYRFLTLPPRQQLFSLEFKEQLNAISPDQPFFFDVDKVSHRTLVDQALYLETKMRLLNLTLPLADKMSMANSVELRPPFLDHDLVNFAFRIPDHYKIKALEEKYILKRSAQGFLPDSIWQRKKQPLQPPGRWFVEAAHEMINDFLSPDTIRQKGYFDPDYILNAQQANSQTHLADYSGVLIVAFFVHLWDEMFLR